MLHRQYIQQVVAREKDVEGELALRIYMYYTAEVGDRLPRSQLQLSRTPSQSSQQC